MMECILFVCWEGIDRWDHRGQKTLLSSFSLSILPIIVSMMNVENE